MKRVNLKSWRWWEIDVTAVAICVAVTAGVCFLGIRPLFRHHSACAALQSELVKRGGESRGLAGSLRDLQDRYEMVRNDLRNSPLRLQATSHINRQIGKIADLAATCGLKVDQIQPDDIRGGSRYEVVPIHLSGQGSYPVCIGFLRQLRKQFPDTGVTSMDLQCNRNDLTSASFKFILEWYAAPTAKRGK